MSQWTDEYYTSADGLRLHYRDHRGPKDRPPILCLPGLTRNARDFEPVAERFGGEWRVIAMDFRGRGLSAYDPQPERYLPPTYATDVIELLNQQEIERAVIVGTSLGGIVTMLLGIMAHARIAGALLNDVGPEFNPAGVERIKSYVGRAAEFSNWEEFATAMAAKHSTIYPKFDEVQWLKYARRLSVERNGKIEFDYDMAIANSFNQPPPDPPISMWPLFQALDGIPLTILRGELSDLFDADVAEKMAEAVAGADLVTVPAVGHTPTLEEPESIAAIEHLLERVLASSRSA